MKNLKVFTYPNLFYVRRSCFKFSKFKAINRQKQVFELKFWKGILINLLLLLISSTISACYRGNDGNSSDKKEITNNSTSSTQESTEDNKDEAPNINDSETPFLTCQDDSFISQDAIAKTPRPDRDAELLVIDAFPAFVADDEVYERVARDLKSLREKFSEDFFFPCANRPNETCQVHFSSPFSHNKMGIRLTDEGSEMLAEGTFDELSCLNQHLNMAISSSDAPFFTFETPANLNLTLVAKEYEKLPHVLGAGPISLIGNGQTDICLSATESEYYYVTGYCNSLFFCRANVFAGFKVEPDGSSERLGTFNISFDEDLNGLEISPYVA